MKQLINIAIVGLLIFGGIKFKDYLVAFKAKRDGVELAPEPQGLAGVPSNLENSLADAQKRGADGLKAWLTKYRGLVKDPRLAEIQLDYIVLIGTSQPDEAKRLFASVKRRVKSGSPLYDRVQKLSRTYE